MVKVFKVHRVTMSGLTQVARRTALSLLSGAAFLFSRAGKSEAAFGDAARVFGSKPTNTTGEFPAAVPMTSAHPVLF